MSEPREITERYRLEKILKSSRSGNVLKATDETSGRSVVVKMISLFAPTPEAMARFERLAAALAGSSEPCFPRVSDSGFSTDGAAFLVFENLEGRGFESLAGGRGQRVLHLVGQVIDGLDALAGQGLFHGSLSPDNLLVIRPQADGVKTFGLGTALFRTPQAAAADAQNARYRAPEELPGGAPLPDGERWRSDLYSLALTACRVLGAEVTFADTPTPKVMIPTVLGFELKMPEALRQMLEGSLRRNPAERPTLEQARNALRRAMGLPPAEAKAARPAPAPAAAPPKPPTIEETRPAFIPPPPAAAAPPAAPPPAPAAPPEALGALDLSSLPALPDLPAESTLPPLAPAVAASPTPALASPAMPATPAIPPISPKPPVSPAPEETAGGLLSIDDDLLGDLPPALPPSAPAATASTAPGRPAPGSRTGGTGPLPVAAPANPAAPTAPTPPLAAGLARFKKPVPLAIAGGALLLLIVGAVWLLTRSAPPPPPVAAAPPRPAVPAPPPPPPPGVRLATAKSYLAQGQEHEALAVLRTLTAADQQALTPPDAAALREIQATLTQNAPARIGNDLAAGLKGRDVTLLHAAVEDAAQLPPTALVPSVQADLAKAKPVSELYDRALAADRQGQAVEVLARFGEMAKLLPGDRREAGTVRDSSGLRDRAAQKLEAETDALLKDARYDEALAHLEPLSRTWPDRSGLKAKLADVRALQKAEASVQTAITQATEAERLKQPDEGLAALERVKPTPHLQASYDDVKQRLETLLARFDSSPPTVELRDGFLLDYDRGTPVNLSFRVRDDYKVSSVKIYARPGGGGRMQEMQYTKEGFTYTVVITPDFHQNQTVDFYVVATDPSGHQTSLGSKEKPMQLKRKKGFRET